MLQNVARVVGGMVRTNGRSEWPCPPQVSQLHWRHHAGGSLPSASQGLRRQRVWQNTGTQTLLSYWQLFSRYLKSNYNWELDHVERKVQKYEYHKIWERKVKTLTRNWRDPCRIGTRKHTETVSRYFDRHGRLYQSKESKCLWTHDKAGVTREFMKGATRGLQEGWKEGNYLRLMPGLSLEDRTNW